MPGESLSYQNIISTHVAAEMQGIQTVDSSYHFKGHVEIQAI